MLFFSCVVIKVGVLAETPEVESILPPRLEQLFQIPVAPLSVVIFSSVVVSLLVSLAVTLNQVKENRLRQLRDARAAVARRRARSPPCRAARMKHHRSVPQPKPSRTPRTRASSVLSPCRAASRFGTAL